MRFAIVGSGPSALACVWALMDSDIEVTDHWLEPLMEVMKDETVAGCQPKILSYSNRKLILELY